MISPFARKKELVSAPTALAAIAIAAHLAGCHSGPYVAPAPLKSTAMPSNLALKPWDTTQINMSFPSGMALVGLNQVFVALGNLGPNFSPNGPGLLVALTPNTGATTVIDLAGSTSPAEHACSQAGAVKADSGKLYVACTGSFAAMTGPGRAVVEVDAATLAVTHLVPVPANFLPDAVAVTPDKIWLGNSAGHNLLSVDRHTFALVDGADPNNPLNVPRTDQTNSYISALEVFNGDLFALCGSSTGEIGASGAI